jgi:hypothetical protein
LVYRFVNGLSDHNAQIIILGNIEKPSRKVALKNKNRVIDAQTIAKFQLLLKEETWDIVYDTEDVNSMFNNFHGIFLRHFEHSFPIIYKGYRPKNNEWIMNGIKISCMRKRNLYSLCRNTNSLYVKEYYKKYCAVLKRVITEPKKLYYNTQIEMSK